MTDGVTTEARTEQHSATRYVDAARDLASGTAGAGFTVQQVVREAGGSLKAFYRHFAGKDDLLCALFAEDCAAGAQLLAEMVERHRGPEQRIRAWVTGMFSLVSAGASRYVEVLVREHRRLAETRPLELDVAMAPLLDVLVVELVAHGDPDPRDTAAMVFSLTLVTIDDVVLGRGDAPDLAGERLWRFCWSGIGGAA
ncbi:MAG TPA: TetR/AcrR family transcriptional regulator [Microthrixaceae bacterium]|nr:TetR/AcrR family transcriptional regulator [Microthrixaceae bacterium]